MSQIEEIVDNSGVVEFIEARISAYQKKQGRPRELSVKALLVALLANAERGELFLTHARGTLDCLSGRDKMRLGITRQGHVTRRQVENLYGLICRVLRTSGEGEFEAFDEVCSLLLRATAHSSITQCRDIAIDGTGIESWGRMRGTVVKTSATGEKTTVKKKETDPDARWRGKGTSAWKRPIFGYDMTTVVTIPDLAGRPVALAATAMRFRPAGYKTIEMALEVAYEMAKIKGGLGDVLADREYTQANDGSNFILPLRALGAEPVFQLKSTQQGGRGTVRGAVIVDGQPYSPSIPAALLDVAMPPVNATIENLMEYQRKIRLRDQYRMVPHGSRKADGSQVYQCPAAAGKLRCPLVASSQLLKLGTMVTRPPMMSPLAGTVCTKKFTTFSAAELPLSQREQYGSFEWYMSMNRRNRVEGFFGNLKDQGRENIRRGTIRVMGLIKTGLLVAMAAASVNLRLGKSFDEEERTATATATKSGERRKKMGRPRKTGVAAYARVFEVSAQGPPDG